MDTISFGPDRPPRRWLPLRPSRRAWLSILAAAAVACLVVVVSRGAGGRRAGATAAEAMPPLLSGVPARNVHTSLIIGGDSVWRLDGGPARVVLGGLLSNGVSPLLHSVSDADVSEIVAVPGGVVALMSQTSSPRGIHETPGPVLALPAGAGPDRVIARASTIAVAAGGRSVWLQTATQPYPGPPSAMPKPVLSPTFAVSLTGRRVSPVLRLPLGLIAATSAGLLTDSVTTGKLQLWNSATGRPQRLRLPGNARVIGEGGGLVIWQAQPHRARCRGGLYLTDLRGRRAITMPVPAGWWPTQYQEPAGSDPSGQRLVIPLVRVDSSGNPTAEDLYVIDTADRTIRPVPGRLSAASQPLGLDDQGVTLAGAWDRQGRLWVLVTSGYGYFQLGYWTGTGPLHVYPPLHGNPVVISATSSSR